MNKQPTTQSFTFMPGLVLRAVTIDGQPWFVVKDLCEVLGLKNTTEATAGLYAREKNTFRISEGIPGNPIRAIVSESGLYKVVMRSHATRAEPFQDWVASVVLPAIRKDGAYVMGEEKLGTPEMDEDELVARALVAVNAKLERVTRERDKLQPMAYGMDPEEKQEWTVKEYLRRFHPTLHVSQTLRIQMGQRAASASVLAQKDPLKQARVVAMSKGGTRIAEVGVYSLSTLDRAFKSLRTP